MITNVQGLSENRIAPYLAPMLENGQGLVITTNAQRAHRIATDLAFFSSAEILVLPDFDPASIKFEARSREALDDKLKALFVLSSAKKCIVIAPVLAALQKLQPKEIFLSNAFEITAGGELIRDDAIMRLVYMGYERVPMVEAPGQFSVRGDIIDIFSPGSSSPVRVELFDTEVDSLRSFDALTQRSIEKLKSFSVFPAQLITLDDARPEIAKAIEDGSNPQYLEYCVDLFYQECDYIWDYMRERSFVAVDDPSRIAEVLDFYLRELDSDESISCPDPDDLPMVNTLPSTKGTFYFTPFAQQIRYIDKLDRLESISCRQAPIYSGHMNLLEADLKDYAGKGYKIVIACSTTERYENLKDFISRAGIESRVELRQGMLTAGTEFPDDKILFLSESDIFRTSKKGKKRRGQGKPIRAFTDIQKGDYIVHEAHGVGQFIGVERLTVDGSSRDYLKIRYAGTDALYVPVDKMESIQKYVGSEGHVPKVSKLSGSDWQLTKAKARVAIMDMAEQLLKASAQREINPGYQYGPDSSWQKEFEEAFQYEETDDQLRCSEEIKQDMQKSKAMDRLLCGDVGYGKTEVAARAIFKALEAGKQVAVLVPTTVLCSQHYRTFTERFAAYPFSIDMMCRFRSDAEQEKTAKAMSKGDVDLVVGTHRLLSQDIKFKDLGLLVIDEEQRFGVEHKEKIKRLKSNVDVLTLSATPIPRTLHMSLIGVKDMSVIEEPPEGRYPVQTYVTEQDDRLIADVIRREVGRGGQVYLVYNRVKSIAAQARRFKNIMPEIRFQVAHGQMGERQLEDTMLDFQAGGADVLITTTIIESGLDIPNVNTLIVLDADRFGLSQLYQLRGRVGRSNRMAYAYLMYKKDKVLTEAAEKRMRAIKEFTEFGSGFRIAMRDLELRGAGNILGKEQSGHILSIGYELYCKLVEEAVSELKGDVSEEIVPEADTDVELGVSAFLPDRYVSDELVRLDMYKRIAGIAGDEDRAEVYDELSDRFGDPPQEALNLLDVAMIRNKASRLGIQRIVKQQTKIVFFFEENNALTPEIFAGIMDTYGSAITVLGSIKPRITLDYGQAQVTAAALHLLNRFN